MAAEGWWEEESPDSFGGGSGGAAGLGYHRIGISRLWVAVLC